MFVLLVLQTDEIAHVLDVLLQVSHLQLQFVALQLLFKLLHTHTHINDKRISINSHFDMFNELI